MVDRQVINMHTLTFSSHKQTIAEFRADTLSFERQPDGLLVSAEGEMLFQDTALLENFTSGGHACTVTLRKDGEAVIDDRFEVAFFTLEPNALVVRLS